MRIGLCVAVSIGLGALGLPAAAQDAAALNVRFCGVGFQGEAAVFRQKNPRLAEISADRVFWAALYQDLLTNSPSSQWGVNFFSATDEAGRGATFGLSHVLTYESADRQKFRDPRDGLDYYNTTYSVGINTVLFDVIERQVRTIIPAVIVAANVARVIPTPQQDQAQFRALLQNFDRPDSAVSSWLASIKALPVRYDERSYLQVLPLQLSNEVSADLEAAALSPNQSPANFTRNATAQFEAMTAVALRKPMIPVSLASNGEVIASSQYLASIPECLGQTAALALPPPSFQLRITAEKLLGTSVQHQLPGPGGASFQTELAFGGRYRAELAKFDSLNGTSVIDSRTLRFEKSIRYSGERDISAYEQYFKLTSNFMRQLLDAYVRQDASWVKAHMSTSVIDKKARDADAVAKAWKAIVRDQMKIAAPVKAKGGKDA